MVIAVLNVESLYELFFDSIHYPLGMLFQVPPSVLIFFVAFVPFHWLKPTGSSDNFFKERFGFTCYKFQFCLRCLIQYKYHRPVWVAFHFRDFHLAYMWRNVFVYYEIIQPASSDVAGSARDFIRSHDDRTNRVCCTKCYEI